jgi:hypothetical protein
MRRASSQVKPRGLISWIQSRSAGGLSARRGRLRAGPRRISTRSVEDGDARHKRLRSGRQRLAAKDGCVAILRRQSGRAGNRLLDDRQVDDRGQKAEQDRQPPHGLVPVTIKFDYKKANDLAIRLELFRKS